MHDLNPGIDGARLLCSGFCLMALGIDLESLDVAEQPDEAPDFKTNVIVNQKEVKMFKHILLPTDGSELSAAAVQQGIRFAKSIGSKVTGLCVMPLHHTFFYQAKISKEALNEVAQQYKELAETHLAVIENGAKEAGVECDVIYDRNDSPCDAIIRVAEQKGCDLILMASHGRRGVDALLIGSETQKVITHSKVPVLVYR